VSVSRAYTYTATTWPGLWGKVLAKTFLSRPIRPEVSRPRPRLSWGVLEDPWGQGQASTPRGQQDWTKAKIRCGTPAYNFSCPAHPVPVTVSWEEVSLFDIHRGRVVIIIQSFLWWRPRRINLFDVGLKYGNGSAVRSPHDGKCYSWGILYYLMYFGVRVTIVYSCYFGQRCVLQTAFITLKPLYAQRNTSCPKSSAFV